MLTTAYYFLQVILCSGIMMGYYWLVLRNKRFHHYNRFYLLAIALLSWVVPLVKIQWQFQSVSDELSMVQLLSVVADSNTKIEAAVTRSGFQWSWEMAAWGMYLTVAAVLLGGMIIALMRLYQLLKAHSCKNVGEVYLILTQAKGTPFSFFRYIFWNEEIDIRSEAGKQILQHELTHVKQKHSVDKIIIQLVLVVGWFNPFFWLLKKEMEMIHEFIADKKAVTDGDTAALAHMLLTAAYPRQQFAMTNPFFFSPIKRRLQMLANNRHPRFSYLRRLVVLPLMAVVVLLFAFRNKEQRARGPISVATMMEKVVEESKDLLTYVEKKRTDTIVIQADTVYIQGKDKNDVVKIIPVLAKSKPLSKALIVLDGKKVDNSVLDTLNTNLIASVDVLKGESATSTMYGEDGKNGIVVITTKKVITPKPLMILDGKKVDSNLLDLIDPSRIQAVNVLKNESATALYGEEGKNGVVMITTKKAGNKEEGAVVVTGFGAKPTITSVRNYPSGNSINVGVGQFGAKASAVRKYADTLGWISGIHDYKIPSNVWVLIDGEPGNLNDVKPDEIAEVRVIKDATATAKYGEAAKNGVVEVITKKAKEAMKTPEAPDTRKKNGG